MFVRRLYRLSSPRLSAFRLLSSASKNYTLDKSARLLNINWTNGETTVHPVTWMRDNCQCPRCFNPATKSRALLMRNLDVHAEAKSLKLDLESDKLLVKWNDNHESEFDGDFLRRRSFTENRQKIRHKEYFPAIPQLWDAETLGHGAKIPKHNYHELINNKSSLLECLLDIERFGLTLIRESPANEDALPEFVRKVSYPSITNYGYYFKVMNKAQASNLAFTPVTLGLHSDLPYYERPPGIQILHCIEQTDKVIGGENEFVDSFQVAEQMKREFPKAYEILDRTEIDFYDYGTDTLPDFHLLQRRRTFQKDINGTIVKTFYNNQVRDNYLNIPTEDVQPFYEALRLLDDLMYSKKNIVQIKLKTGDMVVYNNHRVYHGRKGYRCLEGANRYLLGTYIEWDEVRSRIRRLRESLRES